MRSEDGFTVWGARERGEAEADAVGPVCSTDSVLCVELLEGVGWATVVAAAGASAELVPIPVGTAKTETKSLLAARKARPRPGQRSTVTTDAETRATKLFEGTERSSIHIRSPCVRKSQKTAEVKGSPPKTARSVRGTRQPKSTPGIGEGGVFSPQALMRYIPVSSTGLRLVYPLRSRSVAGSDKRDRKSAFLFAHPLRYSSVKSPSGRNSSHLWTRALWFPTLPMLSVPCAWRIRGTLCPNDSRGGVLETKRCCWPQNQKESNSFRCRA